MFQLIIGITCFLFVAVAQTCHPECRYVCDDPVCKAVCFPVLTHPIKCQLFPKYYNEHYTTNCSHTCVEDVCEADSCPMCEVRCTPPKCAPNCQIECEQIQTAWYCVKPEAKDCDPPRCELQCERPTCEAPAGNYTIPTKASNTTAAVPNSHVKKEVCGELAVILIFLMMIL